MKTYSIFAPKVIPGKSSCSAVFVQTLHNIMCMHKSDLCAGKQNISLCPPQVNFTLKCMKKGIHREEKVDFGYPPINCLIFKITCVHLLSRTPTC